MAIYESDSGGSVETLDGFTAQAIATRGDVHVLQTGADVVLDRVPPELFASPDPASIGPSAGSAGLTSDTRTTERLEAHPARLNARTFSMPTGPFEPVRVAIVDEDEDLISNRAIWLLPAEKFPVAVRPRGGFATLRLVTGEVYDKFQLIVENPDGPDVTLYEQSDREVAASDDQAILEFDTGPFELGEDWDGWDDDDGDGDLGITNEDLLREVRRRSGGVSIF